jgi:NADH-quinone oxidoreductase subunit L
MLENFGPIQHVALASLWWLLLFPVAGGAVLAFMGLRWLLERQDDPKAAPPDRATVDRLALATFALTCAASIAYAYELFQRAPVDRFFVTHVLRMVRIGQLDVHLDLVLDPLASVMCVVVTAVATLAAAVRIHEKHIEPWRFHAWSLLFVTGLLLALLADGLLILVIGWHVAGVAMLGLVANGSRAARANVFHRVADVAFIASATILFWSLGGTWSDTEFTPDLNPRYVAVSSAGVAGQKTVGTLKVDIDNEDDRAPSTLPADARRPRATGASATAPLTGKGFVTLANTPGAVVYLDDAHTPLIVADQALRAPFARRETPGGMHTFRIHAGGGLDDHLVAHVPVGGDADTWLVLVGPTVTFRELRDQLALENGAGEPYLRDALRAKKLWGGVSALSLACVLLVLGVAARGALFPLHLAQAEALAGDSPAPARMLLLGLGTVLLPAYLVARVAFLFAASPGAATWLVVLGALTALACGATAHHTEDPARARAFVTVGVSGVAMIALGTGAWSAAIVIALVHALAMAALASAEPLGKAADRRTSIAASVALLAALAVAMSTAATSEGLSRIPSLVVAGAGGLATALFAGVLARTLPNGDAAKPKAPRAVPVVLSLAAVVVAVLGTGGRAIGGAGDSILGEWLAPSFATTHVHFDHEPASAIGLGLVVVALSIGAWLRPQKRASSPTGFGGHAAAGFHVDAAIERGVVPLALGLRSIALELERHVIDGVVHAVAALVRATAWVQRRVDQGVVDAPGEALAEGIEPVATRNLEAAASPRAQATGYAVFCLLLAASLGLYVVSNR